MRRLVLWAACVLLARAFAPVPSLPRGARPSTERYTINVEMKPGESVDEAIMRLRRAVNRSGHLRILRTKRYFEDAREKKKRKLVESRRKKKFMKQLQRTQEQRAP